MILSFTSRGIALIRKSAGIICPPEVWLTIPAASAIECLSASGLSSRTFFPITGHAPGQFFEPARHLAEAPIPSIQPRRSNPRLSLYQAGRRFLP